MDLKAQIPVLKKAYLDEQTECNSAKDQLKEKEQAVRKSQQEVDSLTFRNQQLSKRVLVLQDELEALEAQKKKHKHKGGDAPGPGKLHHSTSVYNEELQSKIEENAKLHSQLHEITVAFESKIASLEERLKTSEQDRTQHEDVVATLRQSSKAQIERLQQEKAMVEVKLQSQENDIKEYRVRAEMAAANLVGELVQGLSNFFTYSEQRSRIYPADGVTEPISPANTKYCKYLHENLGYLRPVEQALKKFSEELKDDSLTVLVNKTVATLKPVIHGSSDSFMSGNLDFFAEGAGYRTRGSSIGTEPLFDGPRSHPAVTAFRHRAAAFLSSLAAPRPDSVPHKVAVQNRKTLLSSAESKEGLAKQIVVFQEKVGRLEQEKEHWVLELQLLRIKYENEQQKVRKLEQEIESLRSSSGIVSTATSVAGSIEDNIDTLSVPTSYRRTESMGSGSGVPTDTSMLGHLEMQKNAGAGDAETREQLIKNHFTQRINDLTLQLQTADSKGVNFHAEVRALHKQLRLAERSKMVAEEELKSASQTMAQLKDELQTTTRSYEGQLSMMSEHLAGMNEKLAQQKDEIDDLKAQQAQNKSVLSKVTKKSKK
nr:hypothetical protein BaRGS_023786 [Batillaria attramentaria]